MNDFFQGGWNRRMWMAGAALAGVAGAACSPLALLNGADRVSRSGVRRVAEGVAYGPDPRLKLDVWAPSSARPGAGLPVIVFFYGGGWQSGERGDYAFAAAALAGRGFVVVVPDYRLVPAVRFPAFVEDCALSVKWVRDHVADFGGDPGRIALSGHSAGAYNAAMLALDRHFLADIGVDPGIVRAAALLSGPYDFAPFTERYGRAAFGQWPRARETQPVNFVRRDAPPMLLIHGAADRTAYPYNSRRLAERLRAVGAPVELKIYPGKNHVDTVASLSRPLRGRSPALEDVVGFLGEKTW
ncbi:alpha/beta hydrolase [Sphingomonas mesophila]|uniref:alpha/beta hydrolase n=1 Tax=Sphingomonas mesophila TaxID=2303576 RepID=UPI000E58C6A1|nr:alpha/beta hydrolase [Sphingomonas mesophila]